jgi:hypothetical protein
LNPGLVMWDLWWKKWRWGRLFSEYFGFPCQSLFYQFPHNHHHLSIIWDWYNGPVVAAVPRDSVSPH